MKLTEIQDTLARIQTAPDELTADRLRLMLCVKALQHIAKDAYQHPLSHHILLAETVLKAVE